MQDLASLLPLILVAVLFYIMLVRPARNRQRAVADLQASLQVGQRVITSAGMHGTIVALTEREVVLSAPPAGAELTFDRQAVMRVLDGERQASDQRGTDPEPGTTP